MMIHETSRIFQLQPTHGANYANYVWFFLLSLNVLSLKVLSF